jgi:hypothetical protein
MELEQIMISLFSCSFTKQVVIQKKAGHLPATSHVPEERARVLEGMVQKKDNQVALSAFGRIS